MILNHFMSLNLSIFYKSFSKTDQLYLVDNSIAALEKEFDFPVKIRISFRARRITLRICHVSGGLKITIPSNLQTSVLRKFINKNIHWVSSNLRKIIPTVSITDGMSLPIKGRNRKIFVDPNLNDAFILKETELLLPKTKVAFERQVKSVLEQIAGDYFRITCADYAENLGVKFSKISLRDPRSRWGSCSSDRNLMFSWRLIMAPLEISSYVAAHEIAHLRHMNHSQKFWTAVSSIYPNYREQRNWLRENGRNLHRFVL